MLVLSATTYKDTPHARRYACKKTTSKKTYSNLGVLSLSVANTQLIFGLFTLMCAAILVGICHTDT